jgi:hypothetical protein
MSLIYDQSSIESDVFANDSRGNQRRIELIIFQSASQAFL